MTNKNELITLGDYRKTARELLYFSWSYQKKESNSDYDIIRFALLHIKSLIYSSRSSALLNGIWRTFNYLKTKDAEYQIRNPLLFEIIKLMEFYVAYKGKSIEEILPGLPQRPDVNAMVFTTSGISYFEAAFCFVRELGGDITRALQNSYKKYTKEGNVIYRDPFKFLRKTTQIDDLEINPEPDIIIKTWFDDIVKGTQKWIQDNNISRFKVEAEFNSLNKQLEYEWNCWKSKDQSQPLVPIPIPVPIPITDTESEEVKKTKLENNRQSITLQQFFKDYCDLSKRIDIDSKREMLLREYRKKNIKLPLVKKKKDYRRGQTYLFRLDELLNEWPNYRMKLTTLPPLKKSGNK